MPRIKIRGIKNPFIKPIHSLSKNDFNLKFHDLENGENFDEAVHKMFSIQGETASEKIDSIKNVFSNVTNDSFKLNENNYESIYNDLLDSLTNNKKLKNLYNEGKIGFKWGKNDAPEIVGNISDSFYTRNNVSEATKLSNIKGNSILPETLETARTNILESFEKRSSFGTEPTVKTYDRPDIIETKIAKDNATNEFQGRPANETSSSASPGETPSGDAPSSGETQASETKNSGKYTFTSDPTKIGTTDSDGNFYMPDDISGGGISAGAKQHAYRKAYDKASGSQKWQDEQIEKIKSAEQPQNMSDEEWQKTQQEQINAVNKQADKMRNDWSTMQKDSTKINPGLSDYVLGNPHTTAGVLGGGALGYLALQLSDSRGQMTNQQLYGQDDLT